MAMYICIDDLVKYYSESGSTIVSGEELKELCNDAGIYGNARFMSEDDINDCYQNLVRRIKKLEEVIFTKNINYSANTTGVSSIEYVVKPIQFESREEAIYVLRMMKEKIQKFGYVTVANYYYISGKPECISHAVFDYGWTNLEAVAVYSYLRKNGLRVYALALPSPMRIVEYQ